MRCNQQICDNGTSGIFACNGYRFQFGKVVPTGFREHKRMKWLKWIYHMGLLVKKKITKFLHSTNKRRSSIHTFGLMCYQLAVGMCSNTNDRYVHVEHERKHISMLITAKRHRDTNSPTTAKYFSQTLWGCRFSLPYKTVAENVK